MKKQFFCKCGHLMESHRKEAKVLGLKYHQHIECEDCCCFGYVPRAYPNREEKVSLWLIVGMTGLIVVVLGLGVYYINDNYQHLLIKDPDHLLEKKVISYKTVFQFAPIGIILFLIWISSSAIGFWCDYRRRKNIPVKDISTESQSGKLEDEK